MKKRAPAHLVAVATALAPAIATACPCQGASGAAAGVTTEGDRVGASVAETARVIDGAFQSDGTYSPLKAGSRAWALDFSAIVGFRPISRVELAVETAAGRQAMSTENGGTRTTGLGDTSFRARWLVVDEPMPYEKPALPWPGVTVVASLRTPTATTSDSTSGTFSGRTGSAGAAASSEGLGAFEPALGVALVRTLSERVQLTAFGEAGYRFADHYLDRPRQLGPRLLGELTARWAPTPGSGIGAVVDLGWEGAVAYRGVAVADSDQRILTLGAFAYFRAEPTKLRWGTMLRYTPPFDGAGKNATRATSLGVSLGWAL
ncbi:MAG TPA: hypothetical protein VHE30_28910 [Polyangiaceae bacterium]|nr:hypothetical protein [Polyangiaceae bacterium]